MKDTMSLEPCKIDKKISVVIPVYNGEKYIAKAIQSVVDQTLPPHEIIVVNDGSTDASAQVLADLVKKYPIQYYQKENGGQSSARNYGVRASQGDLIAFLDQDDVWYPNHLEELIKPFLENSYPELGWVYSTIDEIGEDDELYRLDVLSYCDATHPKRSLAQCLSTDMFVIPSVTLVSKKAFNDVDGFDERLSGYEDDDLFLRIFTKGYRNVFIDKSLAQWRIHDKSCSWDRRMSRSRITYAKKLLDKYQDNFVRGFRYRTEIILQRFIHIILGELRRATLFNNNSYTKQMRDDLCELYPYMNTSLKLKCKAILIILQYQPFKLFTKMLAKIYWRFNKISERY
jgi:glycosyltransferase involved in cell wall biosynthesis